MKYSLKKFVEICNNCNGKILDKTGKKDSEAQELAQDIINMRKAEKENKEYTLTKKEHLIIYEYLKKSSSNGKYTFLQDPEIVANVDMFCPYIDEKKEILDQKWHVLIALLAYIDICTHGNYDAEEYSELKKYALGEVLGVEIKSKSISLIFSGGPRNYPSILMNKWINFAISNT